MNTNSIIKIDLPVAGLTCGGCVRKVDRALSSVRGVRAVDVDRAGHRAVVEAEEGTSLEALVEAVRGAGFVPGEPRDITGQNIPSRPAASQRLLLRLRV